MLSITNQKTKFDNLYFSLLSDITNTFDIKHSSHVALVEARTYWNNNNEDIVSHFAKSINHCIEEIVKKDKSCLNKGNISLFTTIFKCKEYIDSENIFMTLFTNEEGNKSVNKFWKTMISLCTISCYLEICAKDSSVVEFMDLCFANQELLDDKSNLVPFIEANVDLLLTIDSKSSESIFDYFRKFSPLLNEENKSSVNETLGEISTNFTLDNIENATDLNDFYNSTSSNLTQHADIYNASHNHESPNT